ncbi:hypothetical protein CFR80_12040 [Komagataeibacter oboediens]|uniref:Uncharacterized protein n=1 Tax=Komagataeibacter oboediens TaxID=65958 RepID=A0A318QV74_9PROT|nr:hypothetical protein CFR80_12040 [Komagataeibacter oboediens]
MSDVGSRYLSATAHMPCSGGDAGIPGGRDMQAMRIARDTGLAGQARATVAAPPCGRRMPCALGGCAVSMRSGQGLLLSHAGWLMVGAACHASVRLPAPWQGVTHAP